MSTKLVECATYTPDLGERVRIVIEYAGAWHPIFWIELTKDGSIYMGPRTSKTGKLLYGAVKLNNGQARIRYSDGIEVLDPEVRKKHKLSFHGSGIVNTSMVRTKRTPLRALEAQEHLCVVLFRHPSKFAAIPDAVRKRDVCLRYPVDERSPFYANIYVAPRDKAVPVIHNQLVYQLILMFEYPSAPGLAALTLQMVIGHGVQGPWPPYTCTLFENASNHISAPNQPMQPTPQSGVSDG